MSARTTVPGLLVVAKAAARAGADVLARRWTGHHPAVPLGIEEIGAQTKSSGSDWVTDYDRRAEQAVREVIAGYRPSDEITGEEYGATLPAEPSGYRWSIDPLDGTTNFVRGLPQFCTSVAVTGPADAETADLLGVAEGTERWLAGVVAAPALGRTWFASAGRGASTTADATTPGLHGPVPAAAPVRLAGPVPWRPGRLHATSLRLDPAPRVLPGVLVAAPRP
ncbi:inositol monophosphatase family protein, partial [Micrococcus sp. HSID17227]|uniref:inositol monophosphatase family protein n=1 Tax=Micrococcus sp. HSID17227 TaxID=2419506 RepID=UPI001EE970D0